MALQTLKDFLKEYSPPGQLERLSFGHYFYKDRVERLDLISNNMLGISVQVGQKNYTVGDVSQAGFSYVQEVPRMPNMTDRRIRRRIQEVADSNIGKSFPISLFFLGDKNHPKLDVWGKIVNYQLFKMLGHQEVEREIGYVLYKKGVKAGSDPHRYYDKMDAMLKRAFKEGHRRKWDRFSNVAMNMAFLNLIGEIGAPPEFYERLIDDYKNRPLWMKYGVFLEDPTEALRLYSFACYRDADRLIAEQEKRKQRIRDKQDFFDQVGKKYDTRAFLELVWKRGLKYYNLSGHIPFPHPTNKEDSENFTSKLMDYNGFLEKIADKDYRNSSAPNEFEIFLAEGLYWHLIDKDKKYLDKSLIVSEVQGIMASCFGELMSEAGWQEAGAEAPKPGTSTS
ncbi:MAG: hypothetical protein RRB13_05470 [bacterium]|nr:hypothetical protein [bacterium]